MGALQPIHLLLILAVVVLLFGGSKIPQLMRGIGQGTGEFKKGLEESKRETPSPPAEETKKSDEPANSAK